MNVAQSDVIVAFSSGSGNVKAITGCFVAVELKNVLFDE
jgi:hypothetical protein